MDCAEVEHWLDQAIPHDTEARAAAELHAGSCPRCTAALTAARSIECALSAPPSRASAGFTDGVMARVRADRRLELSGFQLLRAPAMPWWVRAAADPASACALGLAAVLLQDPEILATVAPAFAPYLRPVATFAEEFSFGSPLARTALATGFLPLIVLLSVALYGRLQNVRFEPRLTRARG